MVDQRAAIGIVQQVDELVLDIAIVHVERRHACLVRSNHAFEVFIAVVEVETQMILPRLEALQRGTFLLAAKRVCPQHIGKTARALRKLPPGDAAIAKDDALRSGAVAAIASLISARLNSMRGWAPWFGCWPDGGVPRLRR